MDNNMYNSGSTDNANGQANGAQGNYQNNYQQGQYQPSQYQQTDLEVPMTLGDWLITMLIMMVPCVNVVMMFVWAFSKTERKSKSNYFKAQLIFMGIMLVFYIIFFVIFGAAIFGAAGY